MSNMYYQHFQDFQNFKDRHFTQIIFKHYGDTVFKTEMDRKIVFTKLGIVSDFPFVIKIPYQPITFKDLSIGYDLSVANVTQIYNDAYLHVCKRVGEVECKQCKIEELNLSIPTKKALYKQNIKTLDELLEKPMYEIMKFEHLNRKNYKELIGFFQENRKIEEW